jgi:hypothetical protein
MTPSRDWDLLILSRNLLNCFQTQSEADRLKVMLALNERNLPRSLEIHDLKTYRIIRKPKKIERKLDLQLNYEMPPWVFIYCNN